MGKKKRKPFSGIPVQAKRVTDLLDWHITISPKVRAFYPEDAEEKIISFAVQLIDTIWQKDPSFTFSFINNGSFLRNGQRLDVVFYVNIRGKIVECAAEDEINGAIDGQQ